MPISPGAARHRRLLGRRGRSHARHLGQRLLARDFNGQRLHLWQRSEPRFAGTPVLADHLAVATPDGGGYYVLDAAGQVFAYGDANGALGNVTAGTTAGLNPASAIFVTSDNGGYWVSDALGDVYTFGDMPTTVPWRARTSTAPSSRPAGLKRPLLGWPIDATPVRSGSPAQLRLPNGSTDWGR